MKFRKWLIHKLGGYTKEDVAKIDIPSLYPISMFKCKKLYAQYETLDFERTKVFEDSMKMFLCRQLSEQLFNYVRFYDCYKLQTNSTTYRVEIDVIDYKHRGDK